ncbi:deoxyribodipyrimidine photo-lyase [Nocardioides sp. GY 10113]|uniref:cryptochrome/photolyase family protein n=1 Tax=Nocardioides sp. GY 10113 TaxID=2569761 RepID=UPI0010A9256C|nr:deoxyribodipyrimidine photo-lyase [Nocardioides sp. GY 10113]TIC88146.1 deoxyribodipyrimidine photo-lyase [Nocardioides sp. GY 10113]
MSTSVLWFRRDLRLRDHPALAEAAAAGPVAGLFVLDPRLWAGAGDVRRAWLAACLRSLDDSMQGRLIVRWGDPAAEVPALARAVDADRVLVTGECTPYGAARDGRVRDALGTIRLDEVGTPYAVAPGTVRNRAGDPYRVFTPFSRAWREVPVAGPLSAPDVDWLGDPEDGADATRRAHEALRSALDPAPASLPPAGEDAALERWRAFAGSDLADYADARDLPAADRTSRMSPYLRFGVVHPRQLLHQVRSHRGEGRQTYENELAWREFYADVLLHQPASAWSDLRPLGLAYDDPGPELEAWRRGRTGFPVVDAGMRQLLAEGWMHNRVRMITASFLTKDLHAWWPVGARHFLAHLLDGDLASNNHGWQWVAGTGTDAAPYFRVFNPISQGLRFDPGGDYVRRWVPELAHLPGKVAHEPWRHPDGYAHGYPERIVDHDEERRDALARYQAARA